MHPAVKIIIGFVLIIIGLGFFLDELISWWIGFQWVTNFITVLTGIIPIFLIVVGLFVVWLEIDELRAQKELKNEKK